MTYMYMYIWKSEYQVSTSLLILDLSFVFRGYASSFEWAGQHSDETTRDRWGRRETHIVAIDALVVRSMISQLRPGE